MSTNTNQPYYLDGANIHSSKTGNLVAILSDGEVVMQKGYNGQGRAVKEFLVEYFPNGIPTASFSTAPAAQVEPLAPEKSATEAVTEAAPLAAAAEAPILLGIAPAAPGSGTLGEPDSPEGSPEAQFIVGNIPDSALPVMNPALGIATPEVAAFIKKHRMTPDQVTALVRRLENKMKAL